MRWATNSFNDGHGDAITSPNPLVVLSPIHETPLDSTVMEKPYTVILMEDDVSEFFYATAANADGNFNGNSAEPTTTSIAEASSSWIEAFRSKIPRDYGMSFASVSLQMRRKLNNNGGDNNIITAERGIAAPLSDVMQALRDSSLPGVSDAVLVARGPVSSLCAQYYLESFSLKGLVMIDPILLDDDDCENNSAGQDNENNNNLSALISKLYSGDADSAERFRSKRLLVEPNAVPMMVVATIAGGDSSENDNRLASGSTNWKSLSRFVADRHGDPDGPYGSVPFVELTGNDGDATTAELMDRIDGWIDEELY